MLPSEGKPPLTFVPYNRIYTLFVFLIHFFTHVHLLLLFLIVREHIDTQTHTHTHLSMCESNSISLTTPLTSSCFLFFAQCCHGSYKEFVVYECRRVHVEYIIHYTCDKPLPPPLLSSSPGKVDRTSHRRRRRTLSSNVSRLYFMSS